MVRVLLISMLLVSCSNTQELELNVNYAWWVNYQHEPKEKSFLGIKAQEFDESFKKITIFNCDNNATFTKSQCDEIKRNKVHLDIVGDFNNDGVIEHWFTGVAKTKGKKYYRFLFSLDNNNDLMKVLKIPNNRSSFSIFFTNNKSLGWAMCMECGDLAWIVWKNKDWHINWQDHDY
jgi:hypothetical protein